MRYIYQNMKLKVGAIRIIGKDKDMGKLIGIWDKLHRDVYYVMKIDLWFFWSYLLCIYIGFYIVI